METYRQKVYDTETLQHLQKVLLKILKEFDGICRENELDYFMSGGTAIGTVRHQGFIPWDDDIDVFMPRRDYDRFLELAQTELGEEFEILTPDTDPRYACNVTHLMLKGTSFIPHFCMDMGCHIGMYIDIFPMDNMPDDRKKRDAQLRQSWFLSKLLFLCGTGNPDIPLPPVQKWVASTICRTVHAMLVLLHIRPRMVYHLLEKVCTRYNDTDTKYMVALYDLEAYHAYISKEEMYPLIEMPFEGMMAKMPAGYDKWLRRTYGDYMQLPPEEKRVNHCAEVIDFGEY